MPTLESNGNTILESNATDGAAIYTTYNGTRVQLQYSFYAQSKGSDTPEERERIGNPTGWVPIAAETQQGRTIVIYKFSYDTDLFRPSDPYAYADQYQAIAYSPETGDLIGAYGKNSTFYESSNLPLLDPNFSIFWGEDEDYFLERFQSIIYPNFGDSNHENGELTHLSDSESISSSIGRLYTAAFGRVPDEGGLQYWVNVVNDPLVSYKDVSQNFVNSTEFSAIASPNSSSDVFATALYQNVLGRAPDSSGLDYWTNQLNSGLKDRADILIGFAESPENVALYATLV